MSITVGIRDLVRNPDVLNGYDYVDIEDKRSHQYKGLFVSKAHAEQVKAFLERRKKRETQKRVDSIMQISGCVSGEIGDITAKQIRIKRAQEKYGSN